MRRVLSPAIALVFGSALTAYAQFQIQSSGTTASLRGIANVDGKIAWASGTEGTVLHTVDGGEHWQRCATPPGASVLDFRGVQAFDAKSAIVMSSGKGDLSRIYKTVDGCVTWKLVFTNPDAEGFFDAVKYDADFDTTFILGDPVDGKFRLFFQSGEQTFSDSWNGHPIRAGEGESAFAASNSLLALGVGDGMFSFISGGSRSEIIHEEHGIDGKKGMFSEWSRSSLPFASGASSGAFSIASGPYNPIRKSKTVVVVGGDYLRPDASSQTVSISHDWGYRWKNAQTPPHGYRSAVAYDETAKIWITVGPNGTDISTDDGRNWRALHPAKGDAPDADRNWNALSLPFMVGPKGRIGRLKEDALRHKAK